MKHNVKVAVAGMALSASALIGLAVHEGYTQKAVIPTKGDVPTVGFGSTRHEDGTRVKMGDTTTPVNALKKLQAHVSKEERIFRDSLPDVFMTQAEYDVYMDWVYQYGTGAWNKSSMRRYLLQGEHKQACNALLRYRFVASYDCSTPNNRRCMGVWTRQQERHRKCLEAQP